MAQLPFLTARTRHLPKDIDALVLASDLQGVATNWSRGGENVLLGIEVAEELARLADDGALPPASRMGIVLAGDLYSAPGGDKRGATGDVLEVWHAFADVFRWVAGVAGNHDLFGTEKDRHRLIRRPNVAVLDGDVRNFDGLSIGGVSYIVGNPNKKGRVEESEFFAALNLVLEAEPDLLVLHEGPDGGPGQRGNSEVQRRLRSSRCEFVVCGHSHWNEPLAEIGDGTQVVNVDARVLVLVA